jgi:hypothetical protein
MGKPRGGAFYGDSGTVFNGAAREQIEKDSARAENKGNSVDASQQYAQSEADDEYMEQAERITRSLANSKEFKYSGQFADPEKRREFVEGLAEQFRNPNGNGQKRPALQEPKEEETLSRAADDKFWNDPEEVKKAGKMVRPAKL